MRIRRFNLGEEEALFEIYPPRFISLPVAITPKNRSTHGRQQTLIATFG